MSACLCVNALPEELREPGSSVLLFFGNGRLPFSVFVSGVDRSSLEASYGSSQPYDNLPVTPVVQDPALDCLRRMAII